jgi:hypothetical protein
MNSCITWNGFNIFEWNKATGFNKSGLNEVTGFNISRFKQSNRLEPKLISTNEKQN